MNLTADIFDKRQTNIAKGVALLLMLWHHLFDESLSNEFVSIFVIDSTPIESIISKYAKVCVAIFLFLSGFGLYRSFIIKRKNQGRDNKRRVFFEIGFVRNRLIKLISNYWVIYLLFVPLGLLFGVVFWKVYNHSVLYGALDFLGLAYLFSTSTMNPTWWFISMIIIVYLLFPLFIRFLDYSPELFCLLMLGMMVMPKVSFLEHVGDYYRWFPPVMLGMVFSKYNFFERINKNNTSFIKKLLICVFLLIVALCFRRNYLVDFDAVFSLSVILTCYFIIARIPLLNKVLELLGKHSSNIFLFHTFIYSIYLKDFVYSFKYPPIIFLLLLIMCFALSIVIDFIKRLTGYNKLVDKLIR